jgi:hypothetical protein
MTPEQTPAEQLASRRGFLIASGGLAAALALPESALGADPKPNGKSTMEETA